MSDGPYRVYDVLTGEYLGGYESAAKAYDAHRNEPVTVRYQPRKRKER